MSYDFDEVYEAYRDTVYGYLRYMCRDEALAEDLCQDTFLKIYLNARKFRQQCSVKTWCLTLARNTFLSWARRKRPTLIEAEAMESLPAAGVSPEDGLLRQEKAQDIIQVLQSLNEEMRTILLLRDYHSLSYKEIAQVLAISEGAVKLRIYRAREAYKKRYQHLTGGERDGL